MGGAGSAWIKPKKRSGLRPDALAGIPHPLFVRAGQRFAPVRSGMTRAALTIVRVHDDGVTCAARPDEPAGATKRLKSTSLLALTPAGDGRHYRFLGFASRRYTTVAQVADVGDAWTRVIVPEWHPELPVTVASAAVPAALRAAGCWLACRADLGAPAPARVAPDRFAALGAAVDLSRYPVPQRGSAAVEGAPADRPATGVGCGDVVLHLAQPELEDALAGSVYLTGHAPPVGPGGRAYLSAAGCLVGWREVVDVRPLPNGCRVRVRGPVRAAEDAEAPPPPRCGVADGRLGQQRWSWRTWPRST